MDWGRAYWQCRRLWPACPEFGPESFGALLVRYVLEALEEGHELRRQELHQQELPVANLTALTANLNRDPKKNKAGYTVADFAFFADEQDLNLPDAEAAAAYMALVEQKQLPAWALFCFKEFAQRGDQVNPPQPLAAIGKNVVLLAPKQKNGGLEGLLVARSEASGTQVEVTLAGYNFTLAIPEFKDQIIAREDVFVPVIS